jgi:hypothetical protein
LQLGVVGAQAESRDKSTKKRNQCDEPHRGENELKKHLHSCRTLKVSHAMSGVRKLKRAA